MNLRTTSAAIAALALLVAACGGASSGNGASGTAAKTASGARIATAKSSAGTYLADASGRALYLWVADGGGRSVCTGQCAKEWPPLTTSGRPAASGGVRTGDLGTVKRADGTLQITYNGHPLYYFEGDTAGGQTTGQGSDDFGAKWWLVAPSGRAITGQ